MKTFDLQLSTAAFQPKIGRQLLEGWKLNVF
jgi:hypothetical protein